MCAYVYMHINVCMFVYTYTYIWKVKSRMEINMAPPHAAPSFPQLLPAPQTTLLLPRVHTEKHCSSKLPQGAITC